MEFSKIRGKRAHPSSDTEEEGESSPPIRPSSKNPRLEAVTYEGAPKDVLVRQRARGIMCHLTKYDGQYIDDTKLRKYDITCTYIDLNTGRSCASKVQYTGPYSLHEIKKALEGTKPWELYEEIDLDSHKNCQDSRLQSNPRSQASYIWGIIRNYLGRDYFGCFDGIMPTLTNWAPVESPKSKHLYRYSYRKYDWMLEGIFCLCLDYSTRTRDPEKPHLTGFVSDDAPQHEDTLLTSELTSVLYLAFANARAKRYNLHRVFPVTLVSCSARTMRVIQCIFDSQSGKIEIRKSPIVDFEHGLLADINETKFLTILGWMMGEPIGDTWGESPEEAKGGSAQSAT